jgi:hypothetical protein
MMMLVRQKLTKSRLVSRSLSSLSLPNDTKKKKRRERENE